MANLEIFDYVKVVHLSSDGFTWFRSLRETQTVYKGSGFDVRLGMKGAVSGRVLVHDRGPQEGSPDVEMVQVGNRANFDIDEEELPDWRQYALEAGATFRIVTSVPDIRRIRKVSKNP